MVFIPIILNLCQRFEKPQNVYWELVSYYLIPLNQFCILSKNWASLALDLLSYTRLRIMKIHKSTQRRILNI